MQMRSNKCYCFKTQEKNRNRLRSKINKMRMIILSMVKSENHHFHIRFSVYLNFHLFSLYVNDDNLQKYSKKIGKTLNSSHKYHRRVILKFCLDFIIKLHILLIALAFRPFFFTFHCCSLKYASALRDYDVIFRRVYLDFPTTDQ